MRSKLTATENTNCSTQFNQKSEEMKMHNSRLEPSRSSQVLKVERCLACLKDLQNTEISLSQRKEV